ncbi:DUF58 domain-containing protein [Vibrio paucivorans]|uniref:DUF58 domain-containing protein n=1 Tax=Vibrio paucivorans TaxID=2829489 RepID=A0A9X3CBE9_9VIBR|nr:DUF58 domain-containing protein [Vibrio paucivorans]MCW8332629.1 DUF58 domain-containing protein [Vibrio paucivorans]
MKKPHDSRAYVELAELYKLQFKAQKLNLTTNQTINSLLNGAHPSRLRGRGLNFEELKQYQVGDDIRTMDWKVTMRTGKPHVKVFSEEKDRAVYVLVDQRQSMLFGSQYKMKSVIAAELSALLGWISLTAGDRVGGVSFTDNQQMLFKPSRSKNDFSRFLRKLVEHNHMLKVGKSAVSLSDSLNQPLKTIANLQTKNSLIVLISDGRGWDDRTTKYVKALSQQNELVVAHVTDPLELELPTHTYSVVSDGQSQFEVDLSEHKQQFEQAIKQQIEAVDAIRSKYEVPLFPISTLVDVDYQLRKSLARG